MEGSFKKVRSTETARRVVDRSLDPSIKAIYSHLSNLVILSLSTYTSCELPDTNFMDRFLNLFLKFF